MNNQIDEIGEIKKKLLLSRSISESLLPEKRDGTDTVDVEVYSHGDVSVIKLSMPIKNLIIDEEESVINEEYHNDDFHPVEAALFNYLFNDYEGEPAVLTSIFVRKIQRQKPNVFTLKEDKKIEKLIETHRCFLSKQQKNPAI